MRRDHHVLGQVLPEVVPTVQSSGCEVRYRDINSIFVKIRSKDANECMEAGKSIKRRIYKHPGLSSRSSEPGFA